MKPNLELKEGNVVKVNDIPTFIVSLISDEIGNYEYRLIYLGYNKNKELVKITEAHPYDEDGERIEAEVICSGIQDLDNILKAF